METVTLKFYVEKNGERIMEEATLECELHPDGLSSFGELAVHCAIAQKMRELARQGIC